MASLCVKCYVESQISFIVWKKIVLFLQVSWKFACHCHIIVEKIFSHFTYYLLYFYAWHLIVLSLPFAGSLHEDDTSRFPELDIIALDAKSEQEVPVFEKHVMIIHKNRGCSPEDLSATVDNQGLPNQQVGYLT